MAASCQAAGPLYTTSGDVNGRVSDAQNGTTLLVFIPTYNRPESLRRQVAAVASQRSEWPGRVRILISDNASDAYTAEDLNAIAAEFDVEVRRNPGNIGANANISLGFVLARYETYLWILSDNDTVAPGALRFIAENGVDDASDAIVFSTKTEQVADATHAWESAWDGVGESGLISNVIYRLEVFGAVCGAGLLLPQHELPASGRLACCTQGEGRSAQ